MTVTGASIWDQETGQHVFDIEGQKEVTIREWKKVFDKHKAAPPKWSRLEKEYGDFEPGTAGAPEETPPAELLYRRAQNAKDDTSGGSDGWTPPELKALPYKAWESRAQILNLAGEIEKIPRILRNCEHGGHR